tara:strand:- start:1919 stop:2716 length:798 start_codon:yes stop_codon:yes gene_type:complete
MFRVSCIQLRSNDDIKYNITKTKILIHKAIKQKSDFILTPEVSSLFSLKKKDLLLKCKSMSEDNYLKEIKKLAKFYKKWILVGSLIIKIGKKKLVNRSVLVNNKGKIHSFYDKIHMYDVVLSKKEKYTESKTFSSGKKLKTTKLPWGKLGMTVCYDLRFPGMYRKLAKLGSLFISVPSAFTETTGKKHWHSLLKARAIENFCYIFAPAQAGTHYDGRKTFGHSLIISPDGKILKELRKNVGVITTVVDPNFSKKLRKMIPSLKSE